MKRKQRKFLIHNIRNEINEIMVNQIIHDITGDIRYNFYSINYIMDL